MNVRNIVLAVAGMSLATLATPAAASVTIDFGNGNSPLSGSSGNTRTFNGAGGVEVQASAWSFDGSKLEKAYLGWYGNGLGVTNNNEFKGILNTHAVDNSGQRDFILLLFNLPVTIESGVLTPYQQWLFSPRDNDAAVSVASAPELFGPGAANLLPSSSLFATLTSNQWNVPGKTSGDFSTDFNSGNKTGNVWLIGARGAGGDHRPDGFKLTSIFVSPVPEPGTWLMMLLGFGAIGWSMRRTRPARAVPQIA